MSHVLGIDLGGTKTAVGVVDREGSLIRRAERPTPASRGARAVLANVIDLARSMIAATGDIAAVGVGSAGVIDARAGIVLSATDALPGWAGTRLTAGLSAALTLPVTAMNDVHAHALGEAWRGAARGSGSLLLVAVGTGIGGALLIDGKLWLGAQFAAGHLGHVPCVEASGLICSCGRSGHLEALAAGPGIQAAFERGGGIAAHGKEIAALAEEGDALARTVIEVAGFALGRTLGGLINTLDPDLVVVGGGVAQSGSLWWDAVTTGVAHDVLPSLANCPLRPAELGGDAAILGAARAAFPLVEVVL